MKTIGELIALAKRRPGDLYFASAGSGSGTHLAFELFQSSAGIRTSRMFHTKAERRPSSISSADTYNSWRAIRSTRAPTCGQVDYEPWRRLPNARRCIPTSAVSESGLPGYQADAWYGVLGPAKMPSAIVTRLNRDIVGILRSTTCARSWKLEVAEAMPTTPESFAQLMKSDIAKWVPVVSKLNL